MNLRQRIGTARYRLGSAWNALRGRTRRYGGGWDGTQTNRLFVDWAATALPADEELRWSIRRLRDRCRELARNNPMARRYLALLADNVIGPCGITLQAQVKNNDQRVNDLFNDRIEAAWAEWSERPTLDGRLSRVRLEQQLLKSAARDGEVFVRLWRGYNGNRFGLGLEAIDPDLLDEEYNVPPGANRSEIRMGIELGAVGQPVAYHFWSEPAAALMVTSARRHIRVPADEVIHLYDPDRVAQSRGVPWMAAVMTDLKMLDGYEEAALIAARLGAMQTMWWVEKDPTATMPTGDENNQIPMDVEPGQSGFAPKGYEPQMMSPTYPHTNYAEFVKESKRRIATGLLVAYNSLAGSLEDINYSSFKAGLSIERDNYRSLQHWWIGAFESVVYREFISMALLTGAISLDTRLPEKFLNAKWSPRGWPSIEPLKEAQAAIESIKYGLASRTGYLAERGEDLEDVFESLKKERELAEQHGIEVAGETAPIAAEDDAAAKPTPEPATNGYGGRIAAVPSAGRRT
jgi:lambda family phage portal protein